MPRAVGRLYFAVQGLAGALWWILVPTVPAVRHATLDGLDPLWTAVLDLPLFVLASALAAVGRRWAVAVVTPWTLLVTLGMVGYATVTGQAGAGALAMIGASAGSLGAAMLLRWGRIPVERAMVGPVAFRPARRTEGSAPLRATLAQMLAFWALFLLVIPAPIACAERRWGLSLALPTTVAGGLSIAGIVLIVAASTLGVWSAVTMAQLGRGTPLPGAMAHHLVIAGPYRWIRNPMAVAGIAQGAGMGLLLGSWLVLLYAVAGGVLWHVLVRPAEERDLAERFGQEYVRYRARVRCWLPRG
ncbi:methyltransferase family protein [Brachybacterium saurashtrense]|uniref:methyltransferase family protein n=1 Tax=Brachybacterium saurashtrense TaxID=556288 RepID=UPI001F492F1C|nr:isoprenylcysteine carboxylmethyltransferase family protein [Brachybacterium saurashtrense]